MAASHASLVINLNAICDNWRHLRSLVNESECGAVVKANAYGLGVDRIAPVLFESGCRYFFVANVDEGIQLRGLLGIEPVIVVLQGCESGDEALFVRYALTPVLISGVMLDRWFRCSSDGVRSHPVVIKVNTGMNRLGLEPEELFQFCDQSEELVRSSVLMLMSHLACADEPGHPLNERQQISFSRCVEKMRLVAPSVKTSLANSSGIWLGSRWHGDVVRPGAALYGINPQPSQVNPLISAVTLTLPVIQNRELRAGSSVGYGGTFVAETDRIIAIAAGGYADGVLRASSNRVCGWCRGYRVPLVGTVSMDAVAFDITEIPSSERPKEGDAIELLGEHCSVDLFAGRSGTIGYEVLTRLGDRYGRRYVE